VLYLVLEISPNPAHVFKNIPFFKLFPIIPLEGLGVGGEGDDRG